MKGLSFSEGNRGQNRDQWADSGANVSRAGSRHGAHGSSEKHRASECAGGGRVEGSCGPGRPRSVRGGHTEDSSGHSPSGPLTCDLLLKVWGVPYHRSPSEHSQALS